MTVEGFAIKQPTQQAEPVLDDLGSAEEVTGGDECFGQHGVGVRAARFRPQPTVVGRQRTDPGDGIGEQVTGWTVARVDCQHLGSAERGEGHRTTMRRPPRHAVVEVRQTAVAHPLLGGAASSCPKRPDGSAPTVLDSSSTVPSTVHGASVPRATGHTLGLGKETKGGPPELAHRVAVLGLAHDDDQQAGDIVGAIAVTAPRFGVLGVLEDPDAVTHRQHVGERRQPHDDTAEGAVTSRVPSAS
jgi:hypothetical protein